MVSSIIYTDGACWNNPGGDGSWAYIIIESNEVIFEDSGFVDAPTTNHRMELHAIREALIKTDNSSVIIISDSKYAIDTCTKWAKIWKINNWIKPNGLVSPNVDLIRSIDEFSQGRDINYLWVKGHSLNEMNNRVHQITQLALKN